MAEGAYRIQRKLNRGGCSEARCREVVKWVKWSAVKNQKAEEGASTCRHVRKDEPHVITCDRRKRPGTIAPFHHPPLAPLPPCPLPPSSQHRHFTIQKPPVNNEGAVWAWKASLSASGLGVLQPVNARFAGGIEVFG